MLGSAIIITATLLRVIDGDTFLVNLDCTVDILCRSVPVRIRNIDAPELHSDCSQEKALAKQAKAATQTVLHPGDTIQLYNPGRDKYFRIDAEVPEVENLLIPAGLAHRYNGEGTRQKWCNDN